MKNSMLFVIQPEESGESFGLLSVDNNSPYLECRFSLQHKMLTVVTRFPMSEFKIVPKLDVFGNRKFDKNNNECVERVLVNSFYTTSISNRKDIETFVNYLDSTVTTETLAKYFIPIPTQNPNAMVKAPDGVDLKVLDKDGK